MSLPLKHLQFFFIHLEIEVVHGIYGPDRRKWCYRNCSREFSKLQLQMIACPRVLGERIYLQKYALFCTTINFVPAQYTGLWEVSGYIATSAITHQPILNSWYSSCICRGRSHHPPHHTTWRYRIGVMRCHMTRDRPTGIPMPPYILVGKGCFFSWTYCSQT